MKQNKYKPILAGDRPNSKYLKKEREIDLKYLKHWVRVLGTNSGLEWVITVVNKADLWGPHKNVVKYYKDSGAYAKTIKENIGHVRHYVCPMISSSDDFHGFTPKESYGTSRKKLTKTFGKVLHNNLK